MRGDVDLEGVKPTSTTTSIYYYGGSLQRDEKHQIMSLATHAINEEDVMGRLWNILM